MRLNRTALLLAVLLALATPAVAHAAQPLTFVLAGQSNMAGYGPVGEHTEPVNRHVAAWSPRGWVTATDPLPYGGIGPGPALAFADTVRRATGRDVRLIQCAVGGTELARWVPTGDLYQECVTRVRAAHVGTVSGVLFFQGESDAASPDSAAQWAAGFGAFVAGVRHDFGRKLLPVVYAQLGTFSAVEYPAWETVKEQQASYTAPSVAMVRTDDLGQQAGSLHFTTDSYRIIGKRFAAGWSTLTPRI